MQPLFRAGKLLRSIITKTLRKNLTPPLLKKCIASTITACLLINIAQLNVFAESDPYEKTKRQNTAISAYKTEGFMVTPGQIKNVKITLGANNTVLMNGKVAGIYDAKTGKVSLYQPDGSFKENKSLSQQVQQLLSKGQTKETKENTTANTNTNATQTPQTVKPVPDAAVAEDHAPDSQYTRQSDSKTQKQAELTAEFKKQDTAKQTTEAADAKNELASSRAVHEVNDTTLSLQKLAGKKLKEASDVSVVNMNGVQDHAKKRGVYLAAVQYQGGDVKEAVKGKASIVHLRNKNSDNPGTFAAVATDGTVAYVNTKGVVVVTTLDAVADDSSVEMSGKLLQETATENMDDDEKNNTTGVFDDDLLNALYAAEQTNDLNTREGVITAVTNWMKQAGSYTSDQISSIGEYLKSSEVFNCAVQAVKQVLGSSTASEGKIAFAAIVSDIVSGNFQTSGVLQLSMAAMQKAASLFGVNLSGYSSDTKDVSALQEALAGNNSVIAHIDLGNGQGHYVTVTGISNGQVTYVDSDQQTKTASVADFTSQWSGKMLAKNDVTAANATAMSASQLQATKGAASDTSYVSGLYTSLLGRKADAGGLQYWVGEIKTKGRGWVRQAIMASDEYKKRQAALAAAAVAKQAQQVAAATARMQQAAAATTARENNARTRVNNIYKQYLGRDADPAGMATFTPLLLQKGDRAVIKAIQASDEYKQRLHAQQANAAAAQQAQQAQQAAAAQARAQQQAAAAAARAQQQAAAATTRENNARTRVNNIYKQYLGRDADPEGLAGYTTLLLQKGDRAVIKSIQGSPEYRQRLQAQQANAAQAQQAQQAAAEQARAQQQAAAAAARAQQQAAAATSRENNARTRVNNIYKQYLGRDADPEGLAGYTTLLLQKGDRAVIKSIQGSPEYRQRLQAQQANAAQTKQAQQPAAAAPATTAKSGTGSVAESSSRSTVQWVRQQYSSILKNNNPDAAGLDYWCGVLNTAGSNEDALAQKKAWIQNAMREIAAKAGTTQTTQSTTAQPQNTAQQQVNAIYQKYLGRDADPSGLATYTALLQKKGERAVIKAIQASDEYKQRQQTQQTTGTSGASSSQQNVYAASNRAWVMGQYRTLLGREADADGLEGWTNELNSVGNNASRLAAKKKEVANAIMGSPEYREKHPTTTTNPATTITSGAGSVAESSPRSTVQWVKDQYLAILGNKNPDAGGLDYWCGILNTAGSDEAALAQKKIWIQNAMREIAAKTNATQTNTGNQAPAAAPAAGSVAESSPQSTVQWVREQYSVILGNNNPDAGGLDYWCGVLNTAGSDETALAQKKAWVQNAMRDIAAKNGIQTTAVGAAVTTAVGAQTPAPLATNDPVTAALDALYIQYLGRNIDPTGLAGYATLYARKGAQAVINSLINSDEYVNRRVNQLYQQYLGRDADAGGLRTYAAQMRKNGEQSVIDSLVNSKEYSLRQEAQQQAQAVHDAVNGTNTAWVTQQYSWLLGRSADKIDAAGLAYWVGILNSAGTDTALIEARKTEIINAIKASDEYKKGHPLTGGAVATSANDLTVDDIKLSSDPMEAFLQETYVNYLGREIKSSEMNTWLPIVKNIFKTSKSNEELNRRLNKEVGDKIKATAEFKAREKAPILDWLNQVYNDMLGRDIDAAGAEYWTGVVSNIIKSVGDNEEKQKAELQKQVINAIKGSDEYKTKNPDTIKPWLDSLFTQYLGRPMTADEEKSWRAQIENILETCETDEEVQTKLKTEFLAAFAATDEFKQKNPAGMQDLSTTAETAAADGTVQVIAAVDINTISGSASLQDRYTTWEEYIGTLKSLEAQASAEEAATGRASKNTRDQLSAIRSKIDRAIGNLEGNIKSHEEAYYTNNTTAAERQKIANQIAYERGLLTALEIARSGQATSYILTHSSCKYDATTQQYAEITPHKGKSWGQDSSGNWVSSSGSSGSKMIQDEKGNWTSSGSSGRIMVQDENGKWAPSTPDLPASTEESAETKTPATPAAVKPSPGSISPNPTGTSIAVATSVKGDKAITIDGVTVHYNDKTGKPTGDQLKAAASGGKEANMSSVQLSRDNNGDWSSNVPERTTWASAFSGFYNTIASPINEIAAAINDVPKYTKVPSGANTLSPRNPKYVAPTQTGAQNTGSSIIDTAKKIGTTIVSVITGSASNKPITPTSDVTTPANLNVNLKGVTIVGIAPDAVPYNPYKENLPTGNKIVDFVNNTGIPDKIADFVHHENNVNLSTVDMSTDDSQLDGSVVDKMSKYVFKTDSYLGLVDTVKIIDPATGVTVGKGWSILGNWTGEGVGVTMADGTRDTYSFKDGEISITFDTPIVNPFDVTSTQENKHDTMKVTITGTNTGTIDSFETLDSGKTLTVTGTYGNNTSDLTKQIATTTYAPDGSVFAQEDIYGRHLVKVDGVVTLSEKLGGAITSLTWSKAGDKEHAIYDDYSVTTLVDLNNPANTGHTTWTDGTYSATHNDDNLLTFESAVLDVTTTDETGKEISHKYIGTAANPYTKTYEYLTGPCMVGDTVIPAKTTIITSDGVICDLMPNTPLCGEGEMIATYIDGAKETIVGDQYGRSVLHIVDTGNLEAVVVPLTSIKDEIQAKNAVWIDAGHKRTETRMEYPADDVTTKLPSGVFMHQESASAMGYTLPTLPGVGTTAPLNDAAIIAGGVPTTASDGKASPYYQVTDTAQTNIQYDASGTPVAYSLYNREQMFGYDPRLNKKGDKVSDTESQENRFNIKTVKTGDTVTTSWDSSDKVEISYYGQFGFQPSLTTVESGSTMSVVDATTGQLISETMVNNNYETWSLNPNAFVYDEKTGAWTIRVGAVQATAMNDKVSMLTNNYPSFSVAKDKDGQWEYSSPGNALFIKPDEMVKYYERTTNQFTYDQYKRNTGYQYAEKIVYLADPDDVQTVAGYGTVKYGVESTQAYSHRAGLDNPVVNARVVTATSQEFVTSLDGMSVPAYARTQEQTSAIGYDSSASASYKIDSSILDKLARSEMMRLENIALQQAGQDRVVSATVGTLAAGAAILLTGGLALIPALVTASLSLVSGYFGTQDFIQGKRAGDMKQMGWGLAQIALAFLPAALGVAGKAGVGAAEVGVEGAASGVDAAAGSAEVAAKGVSWWSGIRSIGARAMSPVSTTVEQIPQLGKGLKLVNGIFNPFSQSSGRWVLSHIPETISKIETVKTIAMVGVPMAKNAVVYGMYGAVPFLSDLEITGIIPSVAESVFKVDLDDNVYYRAAANLAFWAPFISNQFSATSESGTVNGLLNGVKDGIVQFIRNPIATIRSFGSSLPRWYSNFMKGNTFSGSSLSSWFGGAVKESWGSIFNIVPQAVNTMGSLLFFNVFGSTVLGTVNTLLHPELVAQKQALLAQKNARGQTINDLAKESSAMAKEFRQRYGKENPELEKLAAAAQALANGGSSLSPEELQKAIQAAFEADQKFRDTWNIDGSDGTYFTDTMVGNTEFQKDFAETYTTINEAAGNVASYGGAVYLGGLFQMPLYASFGDAIVTESNKLVSQATDPKMWGFSLAVGLVSPFLRPILNKTPGMQHLAKYDSFINTNSRLLDKFQGFLYEEGLLEALPQRVFGRILGDGYVSEILQEMFDRTPDGNIFSAGPRTTIATAITSGNGVVSAQVVNNLASNSMTVQNDARANVESQLPAFMLEGPVSPMPANQQKVNIVSTERSLADIALLDAHKKGTLSISTKAEWDSIADALVVSLKNKAVAGKLLPLEKLELASGLLGMGIALQNADTGTSEYTTVPDAVNALVKTSPDESMADAINAIVLSKGGVETATEFIAGVLPAAIASKNVPLIDNAKVAIVAVTEKTNSNPADASSIAALTNIGTTVALSKLPAQQKQALEIAVMTALSGGLNSFKVGTLVSEEATPAERAAYRDTKAILPGLEAFAQAVMMQNNETMIMLLAASVLANPSLKLAADLWWSTRDNPEEGPAQSCLRVLLGYDVRCSIDKIEEIIDLLQGHYAVDADRAKVGTPALAPHTKNVLLNFAATSLAAQQIPGNAIGSESAEAALRTALVDLVESANAEELSANEQAVLLDTIAKLNHVNMGIDNILGVTAFIEKNAEAYNEYSQRTSAHYGIISQVSRNLQNEFDIAQKIAKTKDGKIDEILLQNENILETSRKLQPQIMPLRDRIKQEQQQLALQENRVLSAEEIEEAQNKGVAEFLKKLIEEHKQELIQKGATEESAEEYVNNAYNELNLIIRASTLQLGVDLYMETHTREDRKVVASAWYLMDNARMAIAKARNDDKFQFKVKQIDTFIELATRMFAEQEDNLRYTHVLQTGGGKTYLAIMTALTLKLQAGPADAHFVTMLTNTETNAKAMWETFNSIYGTAMGGADALWLTSDDVEQARQNPEIAQQLRQKLENAVFVVTTYEIWHGATTNDWSTLLSADKPYGLDNQNILKKHDIKVEDTEGKLSISGETNSRAALQILFDNAANGLTETLIPYQKIQAAVADEIDYFAGTPVQALAISQGKYYSPITMVHYYQDIQSYINKQQNVKASTNGAEDAQKYDAQLDVLINKYSEAGIKDKRILEDITRMKNNPEYANSIISAWQNIVKQMKDSDPRKPAAIDDLFAGISAEIVQEMRADFAQFTKNYPNIQYFKEVTRITQLIATAQNREKSLNRKSLNMKGVTHYLSDTWNMGLRSRWEKLMNIEVTGANNQEQPVDQMSPDTGSTETTIEDVEKYIETQATELAAYFKEQYGDRFTFTEKEIREHLRNGAGAHRLLQDKEYYVDANDNCIVVTNQGVGVKNLSLPAGMMQVLEVLKGVEVSRPNSETYVANSVFAMSLFSNIVGLTGTVSTGVKNAVFDPMKFIVGGDAARYEGHAKLFQTNADMVRFIAQAANEMHKDNVANFNLILTPDSSVSKTAYDVLIEMGIDPAAIKKIDASTSRKEIDDLADEVKEGKYQFVIGDAYRLGRGWDVGNMLGAVNKFKRNQFGSRIIKGLETKVQATAYLLNANDMTGSQKDQSAGRIDPFSSNRFDTVKYDKDVVSLYSVESAEKTEKLRTAAEKDDGWSLQLIFDLLPEVQEDNEREELLRAGQNVLSVERDNFAAAHEQETMTVEKVTQQLTDVGLSEEQAKAQLHALDINANAKKLTKAQWFILDRTARYYALVSLVTALDDRVLLNKDQLARLADPTELLKLVVATAAAQESTLSDNAREVYQHYKQLLEDTQKLVAAQDEVQSVIRQLSEDDRQGLNRLYKSMENDKSLLGNVSGRIKLYLYYPKVFFANRKANPRKILKNTESLIRNLLPDMFGTDVLADEGQSGMSRLLKQKYLAVATLDSLTVDQGKVSFDDKYWTWFTDEKQVEAFRNLVGSKLLSGESLRWKTVNFKELMISMANHTFDGVVAKLTESRINQILRSELKALPMLLPSAFGSFILMPLITGIALTGWPLVVTVASVGLFALVPQRMSKWQFWNNVVDKRIMTGASLFRIASDIKTAREEKLAKVEEEFKKKQADLDEQLQQLPAAYRDNIKGNMEQRLSIEKQMKQQLTVNEILQIASNQNYDPATALMVAGLAFTGMDATVAIGQFGELKQQYDAHLPGFTDQLTVDQFASFNFGLDNKNVQAVREQTYEAFQSVIAEYMEKHPAATKGKIIRDQDASNHVQQVVYVDDDTIVTFKAWDNLVTATDSSGTTTVYDSTGKKVLVLENALPEYQFYATLKKAGVSEAAIETVREKLSAIRANQQSTNDLLRLFGLNPDGTTIPNIVVEAQRAAIAAIMPEISLNRSADGVAFAQAAVAVITHLMSLGTDKEGPVQLDEVLTINILKDADAIPAGKTAQALSVYHTGGVGGLQKEGFLNAEHSAYLTGFLNVLANKGNQEQLNAAADTMVANIMSSDSKNKYQELLAALSVVSSCMHADESMTSAWIEMIPVLTSIDGSLVSAEDEEWSNLTVADLKMLAGKGHFAEVIFARQVLNNKAAAENSAIDWQDRQPEVASFFTQAPAKRIEQIADISWGELIQSAKMSPKDKSASDVQIYLLLNAYAGYNSERIVQRIIELIDTYKNMPEFVGSVTIRDLMDDNYVKIAEEKAKVYADQGVSTAIPEAVQKSAAKDLITEITVAVRSVLTNAKISHTSLDVRTILDQVTDAVELMQNTIVNPVDAQGIQISIDTTKLMLKVHTRNSTAAEVVLAAAKVKSSTIAPVVVVDNNDIVVELQQVSARAAETSIDTAVTTAEQAKTYGENLDAMVHALAQQKLAFSSTAKLSFSKRGVVAVTPDMLELKSTADEAALQSLIVLKNELAGVPLNDAARPVLVAWIDDALKMQMAKDRVTVVSTNDTNAIENTQVMGMPLKSAVKESNVLDNVSAAVTAALSPTTPTRLTIVNLRDAVNEQLAPYGLMLSKNPIGAGAECDAWQVVTQAGYGTNMVIKLLNPVNPDAGKLVQRSIPWLNKLGDWVADTKVFTKGKEIVIVQEMGTTLKQQLLAAASPADAAALIKTAVQQIESVADRGFAQRPSTIGTNDILDNISDRQIFDFPNMVTQKDPAIAKVQSLVLLLEALQSLPVAQIQDYSSKTAAKSVSPAMKTAMIEVVEEALDAVKIKMASLPKIPQPATPVAAAGKTATKATGTTVVGEIADKAAEAVENITPEADRHDDTILGRMMVVNGVFSVLRPGEVRLVLAKLLGECQTEAALLGVLDIQADHASNAEILAAYSKQYTTVLAALKANVIGEDVAAVKIAGLQLAEDILLTPAAVELYATIGKQVASSTDGVSITDKNYIALEKILTSRNARVADKVKIAYNQNGMNEERFSIDELQKAINARNPRDGVIVRFMDAVTGNNKTRAEMAMDGYLKDFFSKDGGFEINIIRKSKNSLFSPLGAKAVSQAA